MLISASGDKPRPVESTVSGCDPAGLLPMTCARTRRAEMVAISRLCTSRLSRAQDVSEEMPFRIARPSRRAEAAKPAVKVLFTARAFWRFTLEPRVRVVSGRRLRRLDRSVA